MNIRVRTGMAAAATAVLLSLTACAGGGDESAGGESLTEATVDRATPAEAPAAGAEAYDTRVDGDMSAADSKVDAPTVAMISTGQVTLETDDITEARRAVQQVVDTHLGTISEEEASTNEDGAASSTRLVIRVPSKRFTQAMADLEGVADLRSSTSSTEDVTTQVIDNDVRLRAQEKSLERIEALLARAESINEIMAIESQLARRQADFDALRSTQAWLKDQTSLSTITLALELADEQEERSSDGFLSGLDRGWDGLVAALAGLATVLGLVLPFAVLAALVGVPLWWVVRGVRRRGAVADH